MDTEDTPSILAMRTSLFAVASRVASVLDRQILLLQPLSIMQSRQWLLAGSNHVLVGRSIISILDNLVKLLVELLQLRGLGHVLFQHEMGGLVRGVALGVEEFKSIVNESEVEEETVVGQAVTSMADDLDATDGVVAVETGENFVVGKTVPLGGLSAIGGPLANDFIVFLAQQKKKISMLCEMRTVLAHNIPRHQK